MLDITASCDVGLLIHEVVEKSGHNFDEVERLLFQLNLYPASFKSFLCTKFGPILGGDRAAEYPWLEKALQEILAELHIDRLYVTEAD